MLDWLSRGLSQLEHGIEIIWLDWLAWCNSHVGQLESTISVSLGSYLPFHIARIQSRSMVDTISAKFSSKIHL